MKQVYPTASFLFAADQEAHIQPFSQKSRTPTVAKEFKIGLCGVVEADLELFL